MLFLLGYDSKITSDTLHMLPSYPEVQRILACNNMLGNSELDLQKNININMHNSKCTSSLLY